MELPTGFSEARHAPFTIFTRPVYHQLATRLAAENPDAVIARAATAAGNGGGDAKAIRRPLSGRGAVVEIPGVEGETLILKKNRRGGLYGRLVGDVHQTDYAAVSDLFLSETAWKKGVPVALVAFVMAAPAGEGRLANRWRGYCATIKVEGARSLMEILATEPSPARRRAACAAAGRAVQRAHDRGFFHGDLNLGNLLIVESGQGELGGWMVDLAGSTIGGSLRFKPRVRNLVRLFRSAEKWLPAESAAARRGRAMECARFLLAYTDGDRSAARDIIRAAERFRASLFLHRIGWRVTGAGAGRSVRAGR